MLECGQVRLCGFVRVRRPKDEEIRNDPQRCQLFDGLMGWAVFANANGLQEVSGTAYSKTDDSGEDNLREAGVGGAGFLEPSTIESSKIGRAHV